MTISLRLPTTSWWTFTVEEETRNAMHYSYLHKTMQCKAR